MEDLLKEISIYIKARYPIVYLVTSEENRAEKLLEKAGEINKKQCYFWSATGGYYNTNKFGKDTAPINALNTIVDYGVGNPGSILNMLKKVGVKAEISSDPDVLRKAEKLILPGVGQFDAGIKKSMK